MAAKVRNYHPTVKAIRLMERLLHPIPVEGGPVLDPFVGSGTTLVACLSTGHDGIGIERESEYVRIADARIRHWERASLRKWETTIKSDAPPAQETEEMDFFSLLRGEDC